MTLIIEKNPLRECEGYEVYNQTLRRVQEGNLTLTASVWFELCQEAEFTHLSIALHWTWSMERQQKLYSQRAPKITASFQRWTYCNIGNYVIPDLFLANPAGRICHRKSALISSIWCHSILSQMFLRTSCPWSLGLLIYDCLHNNYMTSARTCSTGVHVSRNSLLISELIKIPESPTYHLQPIQLEFHHIWAILMEVELKELGPASDPQMHTNWGRSSSHLHFGTSGKQKFGTWAATCFDWPLTSSPVPKNLSRGNSSISTQAFPNVWWYVSSN